MRYASAMSGHDQPKTARPFHIGIAGAGAVGCHYGSLLRQAGHKVTFMARGAHLEALRSTGLVHVTDGQSRTIPVTADDDPSVLAAADVVVFTCKMTDLDAMLDIAAPHAGASALLLTLQNGVEAPDRVAAALPGHAVVAGTAFIGARLEKPGMVIHSAAGGIRLGLWRHGAGERWLAPLIQALAQAGVPVREEADVSLMLWRKLLWNCGFNALTAITRRFARDVAAGGETLAIVRQSMQEAVAVAQALGVALGEADIRKHIGVTLEMGPVKTSMWQDIERGRRTEVDAINGYVVRRAASLGLKAPVNRMLATLVHAIEQGIH